MTWDEFVKYVNDELMKQGKDGTIKIEYIDFSWPGWDDSNRPDVFANDMLAIS